MWQTVAKAYSFIRRLRYADCMGWARKKLFIVFGTRPEAIKLFPLIRALAAYPELEVVTCVTGQHRGLLDQVLGIAGIRPNFDLNLMVHGQSLDQLTARLLLGIGEALDEARPDRVIVQGDTASAMAGALAAQYRKIAVSHVEAGLRSGDLHRPWPEEANRRIIGALADQHFAPTEAAASALRAENVPSGRIHITGNTVIDALVEMRRRIAADPSLAAGLDATARRFAGKRIVLVTTHRRENLDGGIAGIAAALRRIAARPDIAILYPVHPNPAIGAALDAHLPEHPRIVRTAPLDYLHFVRALEMADIVLSDSGGVQEEAPALGKPLLVLRDTTERAEGLAAGTARLVGTCTDRIHREVTRLLDDPAAYAAMAKAHNPFGDGNAAARIAALIRAGFEGERASHNDAGISAAGRVRLDA